MKVRTILLVCELVVHLLLIQHGLGLHVCVCVCVGGGLQDTNVVSLNNTTDLASQSVVCFKTSQSHFN